MNRATKRKIKRGIKQVAYWITSPLIGAVDRKTQDKIYGPAATGDMLSSRATFVSIVTNLITYETLATGSGGLEQTLETQNFDGVSSLFGFFTAMYGAFESLYRFNAWCGRPDSLTGTPIRRSTGSLIGIPVSWFIRKYYGGPQFEYDDIFPCYYIHREDRALRYMDKHKEDEEGR